MNRFSERLKALANLDRGLIRNPDESDEEFILREYRVSLRSKLLLALILVAVFVLLIGYSLTLGSYRMSMTEAYSALWDYIAGSDSESTAVAAIRLRIIRISTAVFVGVGLAAAGAAMQSMMKNPLADPYTTGISSGALFGATLAMTMGICIIDGYYGRILNAFVFAMVPAVFITLLSRWKNPSPAMIILVGISIMFIFNAFQSYMMLSADPNSASTVYSWSIGSLGMIEESQVPIVAVISLAGLVSLMILSRELNALNSGDAYAKSLGINVDHTRIACLILISVIAAGIVSFTGIIGFIGLVSPHIARIFVGADNRVLIPISALVGAVMMLVCLTVGFLLFNFNLQIGIVTAMIGGPIFMMILLLKKKEVW